MTIFLFFTILLLLLLVGITMPVALGTAAIFYFVFLSEGLPITILVHNVSSSIGNYVLLPIVLFVFYSRLCCEMNVRARLASSFTALFGRSPMAASWGEVFTSLLQPDSGADAFLQRNDDAVATVNRLRLAGVPGWSAMGQAALLAFLRTLAPPSVFFIILALLTETSILRLFFGIAPLVVAAGVIILVLAAVATSPIKNDGTALPVAQVELGALVWLLAPFFIIGSMFLGLVTPAEAGALAVAFALLVGVLQGQLSGRRFLRASLDALQDAGAIVLVIVFASGVMSILSFEHVPQMIMQFAMKMGPEPSLIGVGVVVVLVLVSALLGPAVASFVVLPILFASAIKAGLDATGFVVASGIAISFGLLIPPTGSIFATLTAGTTERFSRVALGLGYFSVVAIVLLVWSLLVPLWQPFD